MPTLVITGFTDSYHVSSPAGIESVLMIQDANGYNAFWITREQENTYPAMHIMVAGKLAVLHYYAHDRDPGRHSRAAEDAALDPDGDSTFHMTADGEPQAIWNQMVVPHHHALAAATQFLNAPAPPSAITWESL